MKMTFCVADLTKILSSLKNEKEYQEPEFQYEVIYAKQINATSMWLITDFYSVIVQKKDLKHEVTCKLGSIDIRKYCITLSPSNTMGMLNLSLDLISCNNRTIESSCAFHVSEPDGSITKVGTVNGATFSKPIRFRDFYYTHSRDSGLPIKNMCLVFTFTFNVKESLSKSKYLVNIDNLEKISSDFQQLLEKPDLSDVVLQTKNGTKINAHRSILSVRSPVFASMFNHETREKQEGVIEISDIEPEILRLMLIFIYTGRVDQIEENAHKLFKAADKYALDDLKKECEKVLCFGVSIENVIDTLLLADLHCAINLKQTALQFAKDHLKEVIQTASFENLLHSDANLTMEILKYSIAPKS